MLDGANKSPSVRRQCALLGVARSGVYRVWNPANDNDAVLMRRIDDLFTAWPFLGSRRMTAMLRGASSPKDTRIAFRRELLHKLLLRSAVAYIECDQERRRLSGYTKTALKCELEYLPSLLTDLVVQNAQPPGCDEPERKVVNSRRICRTLWLPQPLGKRYHAEAFW